MASPRVIFVNRVYWPAESATAQLLTDLAEALAARGRTVTVIAAGPTGREARNGVTIERVGGSVRHAGRATQAANYLRFHRDARRALRRLAGPGDVVVLKTDPPLLAVTLAPVAAARGAVVVHWNQDIYPEILSRYFGPWMTPLCAPLRALRNRAWRAAAACVTVGPDMRRTVVEAGVSADRAPVIPNWAPRELDAAAGAAEIAAIRRDWAVGDALVTAYSGNLGRVHEFRAILEAAARLRDRRDILFLFIGDGPRFAEVRTAATAQGLAQVRFLPPQPRERLAATLAAADAHFVTLRPGYEPLVNPSKLAGVLAAGRPALFVGPAGGGIPRLLEAEACGWSFSPDEGAALADRLIRLRENPVEAGRAGQAARAAYVRHFTFAAAVDAWDGLLGSPTVAAKPHLPNPPPRG